MTLTNFGNNFEIEEDSNGDYVVTYTPTSTVIERIDSGDEEKILEVGTRISDLVDNTSGNTVYNSSAQEFGDGNQDADLSDVTLADIIDTASGNTVYDSSTETIGDGNQDVSVKSVDADELSTTSDYAQLYSGVWVVNPAVPDVGAVTMDLINNVIDADDVILYPAGTYTQSTQINITSKRPKLLGLSQESYAPSVSFNKDFDDTAIIVDDFNTVMRGITVDGDEVADSATSHGVEIRKRVSCAVFTRNHGGHGAYLNQNDSDSNLNGGIYEFRSDRNGVDGVRVDNTSGGPTDLNGPTIRIYEAFGNGGDGVHTNSISTLNVYVGKANQNGGWGVNIKAPYGFYEVQKTENNAEGSVRLNDVGITLRYGILSEGVPAEPNFPGGRNVLIGAENSGFRPADHTNSSRQTPSQVPQGSVIYNDDDGTLNINAASGWVLPDGSST